MTSTRRYLLIAGKISQMIQEGLYPPGSRLPGERELAQELGVSRVTIREAEIALQAQGYLTIKTGSGVYVADAPHSQAEKIPEISAYELTEARLLFESEAAALAARAITNDTLDHLAVLLNVIALDDPENQDAFKQADKEFHLTIAVASGNAAVQYSIENLWRLRRELKDVASVHDSVCAEETASERYNEHAAILAGLRNRNPSEARQAMQQHFRRLLQSMIDVTEEQALAELRRQAMESRQRYLDVSITA
ncbi:FCD domain-containing protein [Paraglaciecola sp.]|nr:FCD domain-containing protein [Paraglaciecola sp.]MDB4281469.1 FCD domain-containing protein [Paraglaciecola sp.]